MIISNRKFGKCIVPGIIMSGIIMYFSAFFFDGFNPGFYLNMVPVFGFPVLLFAKRGSIQDIKKNMLTPGFWAFVIVVLALFIVDYKAVFTEWDELSHWGMMVKEMLRIDGFYSEQMSHLYVHKEYPPFASLFELLFCRISGGYSEMMVSFAIHLICFSLLIVFPIEILYEKIDENKDFRLMHKVLILLSYVVIALIMVNSMDTDHKLMTIYTDGLVALELFYGLVLIYTESEKSDGFELFSLCMISSALVLTKQIGFVFAFALVFYYVFKSFVCKTVTLSGRSLVAIIVLLFVIPSALWLTWRTYISGIELAGQQFGFERINLSEVLSVIKGGGTEYEQQVVQTYAKRLLKKGLLGGKIKIPMTYIIPIIWGMIMACFVVDKKGKNKREGIVLGIVLTALVIGYVVTMFVLYLFCFPNEEPAVCYPRYMSTIIIPIIGCLLIAVIMAAVDSRSKKVMTCVLVSLFILTFVFFNVKRLEYLKPAVLKEDRMAHYREIGDIVNTNASEGSSIYIIGNSNADYQYFVGYYANENVMDFRAVKNFLELDYSDEAVCATVRAEMLDNDYVFVDEDNAEFENAYGDLVDGGKYTAGALYKVNGNVLECVIE